VAIWETAGAISVSRGPVLRWLAWTQAPASVCHATLAAQIGDALAQNVTTWLGVLDHEIVSEGDIDARVAALTLLRSILGRLRNNFEFLQHISARVVALYFSSLLHSTTPSEKVVGFFSDSR
jgi:hypothetical protein